MIATEIQTILQSKNYDIHSFVKATNAALALAQLGSNGSLWNVEVVARISGSSVLEVHTFITNGDLKYTLEDAEAIVLSLKLKSGRPQQ